MMAPECLKHSCQVGNVYKVTITIPIYLAYTTMLFDYVAYRKRNVPKNEQNLNDKASKPRLLKQQIYMKFRRLGIY